MMRRLGRWSVRASVHRERVVMALRMLLAWLVMVLALPAAPVLAQGFFQWFGKGSPPLRSYGTPYRSPYSWPPWGGLSPYQPYRSGDEGEVYERGAMVRTLCVRLCDGFYFPISNAIPRSELARDATRCSAGCGVEAQLFYHAS